MHLRIHGTGIAGVDGLQSHEEVGGLGECIGGLLCSGLVYGLILAASFPGRKALCEDGEKSHLFLRPITTAGKL